MIHRVAIPGLRRFVPRSPLRNLLVLLCMLAPAAAARAEEPIVIRAQPGVPAPVEDGRVNHAAFDALLKKHVDERGLVDYAAWKAADRPALERYLAAMAAVNPDALADGNERLAYWINVYNALTLHGMLHFYPTKSIKDHVSAVWGFDFWDDVRIEVSGKERSLNHIEHDILRKLGEPRIHFTIVCASMGCPRLRNEAYVGARLQTPPPLVTAEHVPAAAPAPGQLDDQARGFFADQTKFRIDRAKKIAYLSSILDWFGKDFGSTERDRLGFAARYVASESDRTLLTSGDLDVEYLDYDWGINDKARK